MNSQSFKTIAVKVISEAGKPLHYKQITQLATEKGLLHTTGKTPWATMNAQLSMDIVNNGENSTFFRAQPGYFGLKKLGVTQQNITGMARIVKHAVTDSLNTKQKGDIAEARVAELLTLYGEEGLSCYRPISDDEGIDIIAKRREKLEVAYIQVKSSYGYKDRGFVSSVREKQIIDKERMILVFVYFDLSEGDLFDQIFCIPAPDFLRLTANEDKKPGERVFTVGLRNPDKSKYAEFMIEKRELANRIIEILDKSVSALKWCVGEIEKRIKSADSKYPKILILINSLNQVLNFSPAETEDNIYLIMVQGRRYGFYFVIGTDYANPRTAKAIIANSPAKLVFKPTDKKIGRETGVPEAVELSSPDEAILETMFEGKKKIVVKKIDPKKIYEEVFG